jgi:hypothetical protein
VIPLHLLDRIGIAATNLAKQVLGLIPDLIEVGADGKATSGHDKPPSETPVIRIFRAKRRFARTVISEERSGGLGPSRGREAS